MASAIWNHFYQLLIQNDITTEAAAELQILPRPLRPPAENSIWRLGPSLVRFSAKFYVVYSFIVYAYIFGVFIWYPALRWCCFRWGTFYGIAFCSVGYVWWIWPLKKILKQRVWASGSACVPCSAESAGAGSRGRSMEPRNTQGREVCRRKCGQQA